MCNLPYIQLHTYIHSVFLHTIQPSNLLYAISSKFSLSHLTVAIANRCLFRFSSSFLAIQQFFLTRLAKGNIPEFVRDWVQSLLLTSSALGLFSIIALGIPGDERAAEWVRLSQTVLTLYHSSQNLVFGLEVSQIYLPRFNVHRFPSILVADLHSRLLLSLGFKKPPTESKLDFIHRPAFSFWNWCFEPESEFRLSLWVSSLRVMSLYLNFKSNEQIVRAV